MKSYNRFLMSPLLVLIVSLITGCNPDIDIPPINLDSQLIFQSGFEGSSEVVPTSNDQMNDIVGVDNTLSKPNNWIDHFDDHPNIGEFRIYFEKGDARQRTAEIVRDPMDPGNKVLSFKLNEPNADNKGRIQADIYRNQGLKEIYQSVRMYLPEDVSALKNYPERIHWFTIFELWNNASWMKDKFPFRVSVNLEKPRSSSGSDFYFKIYGQENASSGGWNTLWEEINYQVPVPIGEWFTMETYILEGDNENGRVYLAITPENGEKEVVFDVTACSHHPGSREPDGFSEFNPIKLYTHKSVINYMKDQNKSLEVLWDDYRLWKDRRPETTVFWD